MAVETWDGEADPFYNLFPSPLSPSPPPALKTNVIRWVNQLYNYIRQSIEIKKNVFEDQCTSLRKKFSFRLYKYICQRYKYKTNNNTCYNILLCITGNCDELFSFEYATYFGCAAVYINVHK